ncbi:hypothetical protein [Shivajiella indica]|uniref:Uncharacterized protein n=1 Tax=Shivajiella indica TaxID=872115 RepID=A0ABW5B4W6_9BACT
MVREKGLRKRGDPSPPQACLTNRQAPVQDDVPKDVITFSEHFRNVGDSG